jgi:hypothetical protein
LATSATTSLPAWLNGCTYDGDNGNDLRNSAVTAFFYDPGPSGTGSTIAPLGGVLGGSGLLVAASSGMNIVVTPGHFVVPNTGSATAGAYVSTLASQATLTVAGADPTNPRVDIVCAYVNDTGTSASNGYVQLFAGTPAASPVAPSAPANSITLAQIAVAAGATSITSGNITDERPFTVAVGGIPRAPKSSLVGYYGQVAYDFASDSFYHNRNTGGVSSPAQMRVLPFAPVTAVLTGGSYSLTTSAAQVPGLTANVTCDGKTDLQVTYHIGGFTGLSSAATYVTVGAYLDGTLIDETVTALNATVNAQGGFTGIAYTGSGLLATPAAGTHTVTVLASASSVSGGSPAVHAFSGVPASAWMRVEPVGL